MLRACPFCRVLFRSEEATTCPECGLALVPMHELPPSDEAAALDGPLVPELPEDQSLGWKYFARGRGVLLGLSVLGLALFFAPWVEIIVPENAVRSGFDLARGRAGWLWGGAVGYFVLIPLLWTRQTITRMRGVRVAVSLLSVLTLAEVVMLLAFPPRRHALVPFELAWCWGLYGSGLVSLLATGFALRFGGALPPLQRAEEESAPAPGRPTGETLH